MFVSRRKLRAIVDESVTLKKENRNLKAANERLSDSNFDLWWDNQKLNVKLTKKEGKSFGEYFYGKAGDNSDNQSK